MAVSNVLRYKADLDRGISMQVLRPALLTGDNEAHIFMVDIVRSTSAEAIDLSGASVKGYFIRNDNATVVIDGYVEGKSASLSLSSACYAVPGRFSLVVKLIQGITVNAVLWVEGNVGRSNTDTIYDPDHVIPSLEELLAQISAVEAATQAANRAANYVLNTTVEAVAVPSGGNPSVDVDTVNGHMHLAFGLVSGERGPEGPRGPVGPQGETGRGLDIKGIYPSLSALRSGVPNPEQGDMYNVGESAPYTIYMWDGIQNDWISQGVLQGAKGVTYTPIVENGIIRWENDGGLANPPEADIRGPKGDPGTNGKNGTSVTHLWNGTILEVTSASGTSSANLKGADGKTPVFGVDYWTTADREQMKIDVIDSAFPVGSIYMSVVSNSPASFIGGTWERIQDRFLIAAGGSYSAGSTGGAESVQLTENQMPSHRHLTPYKVDWGTSSGLASGTSVWTDGSMSDADGPSTKYYPHYTVASGGSAAHNNMPPYLAVYMWKRVA